MLSAFKANLRSQQEALQIKVMAAWNQYAAPRYDALQPSEQRIIKVAGVVLPLMLLIFGVFLPVSDKHAVLQEDVQQLASNLQEAKVLAALIAQNPQQTQSKGSDSNQMLTLVDKLARESGVRSFMTRLRPQQIMGQQGRLQAQMKSVPYDKLVVFLAALAKHHLPTSSIKIQAATPGVVHVQAVIGG